MMSLLRQVGHGYRTFSAESLPMATGVKDSGSAPVGADKALSSNLFPSPSVFLMRLEGTEEEAQEFAVQEWRRAGDYRMQFRI